MRREVISGVGRARSAEPVAALRAPGSQLSDVEEAALQRLNCLLECSPCMVKEWHSLWAEQLLGLAHREALQQPGLQPPLAAGCPGGTPTVDELRRLQRKISEVTGAAANIPGKQLAQQRVMSNSSVSTMVSDGEDCGTRMRKAWSTDSVSSMVSDMWEDCALPPALQEEEGEEDPEAEEAEPRLDLIEDESQASSECRASQQDFCHPRVPKSLNLAEEFSQHNSEGPPTTMMIRNIPNRYTQRELIRELKSLGFTGTFDFLYVPVDKGTMCNVGYAFVNFIDHVWANRCMQTFENYPFKKHRKARGKVASVSVAHIQGLEANVRHYENAAVNSGAVPRLRQRGPVIMASIEKSLQ